MMIEFAASGRSATATQILRLEIGDDEGVALREDLLGLGHHVGVLRDDGFDQFEGKADEGARLVGLLDDMRAPWMPLSVTVFSE